MADDKEVDYRGQVALDKIRRERERLEASTATAQEELEGSLAREIKEGAREGVSKDILNIFRHGTAPKGALGRSLQASGGAVYGDFDDDV